METLKIHIQNYFLINAKTKMELGAQYSQISCGGKMLLIAQSLHLHGFKDVVSGGLAFLLCYGF